MKKMTRLKQWLLSSSSIYKFEKAYLHNEVDHLGKVLCWKEGTVFIK